MYIVLNNFTASANTNNIDYLSLKLLSENYKNLRLFIKKVNSKGPRINPCGTREVD